MSSLRVASHRDVELFLRSVDENDHTREYLVPLILEAFPADEEVTAEEVASRLVTAFNRYLSERFTGMVKQRMKLVLDGQFSRYVVACMSPNAEFLHAAERHYVDHLRANFFAE
ncbi:MAG TPA: hypothetical protein VJ841_02215 [Candidatus Saccharimonadales bacterium]|nr:hypothetical protein [Candidatus Saccharimonadales bacterium]